MPITNMTFLNSSKKQQSTSDNPSDLDHIKAIGVPISTGYRWKSESIKKENGYYKVRINCGYQSRKGKTNQK